MAVGEGIMSLEIQARLICDNCGAVVQGKVCHRSTLSGESYWDAAKQAAAAKWITVSRGRYRRPAHYCNLCADKPVAKIKDPPRKPKCKTCRGSGVVWQKRPEFIGTDNEGWLKAATCPICLGTGKPKAKQ